MISQFIFFYRQLNLAFFTLEKIEKVIQQTGFKFIKAAEIFQYRKNNNRYWHGAKLYK